MMVALFASQPSTAVPAASASKKGQLFLRRGAKAENSLYLGAKFFAVQLPWLEYNNVLWGRLRFVAGVEALAGHRPAHNRLKPRLR